MSPVHVIVGEDERAEAMWAAAFTGAVDLYRFPRNVDAFERLTAAEAPIDLVVLTPAQRGPFNLTPDQFVARVLEGPLGASRFLANLHVIVVGQPLERSHPRVMAVSTLDAAIRLVKFGEIERSPRPAMQSAPAPPAATSATPTRGAAAVDLIVGDSAFASSVISRIWDAPDAPEVVPTATPTQPRRAPRRDEIVGGGPAPRREAAQARRQQIAPGPANPQLFARSVASSFIVTPEAGTQQAHAPVAGGGGQHQPMSMQVGAPGESIEVATGALQPARPYQLPNGADYRGPAVRAGQVNAASHAVAASGGQPVPPALASQVQTMVYGGMVGNPSDPMLTWSSASRQGQAPVPSAAPPVTQVVRTVPMEPPAGVYGSPAGAAAAVPAPAPADPFLQRAEQRGGDVSFG